MSQKSLPANNGTLVQIEDVALQYGGNTVLHDINFSISKGEFLTVIGPNGAGKTSLVKLLVGLEKPTRGRLTWSKGARLSYVPQKVTCPPFFPMTVLSYMSTLEGVSRSEITQALQANGLGHLTHQPMNELSGGEMQRTLIVRALLNRPDMIILDEPASNLDVKGQISFYQQIEQIHQERGCAVVMVSHDLNFVMARSHNVLCLFRHICCHGAPAEIMEDKSFAGVFGGEMARMLAPYRHQHTHSHNQALSDETSDCCADDSCADETSDCCADDSCADETSDCCADDCCATSEKTA